jgi:hypothetical protein
MENKVCTKCKEDKPLTEYYKRSDSKGFRSHCKKCCGDYQDIICSVCGKEHSHYSVGRKSLVCVDCYPKYRQAYLLIELAKYRAKQRQIKFNLTLDWVLERLTSCPKTGIPFTFGDNGGNYKTRAATTPSIDKIDPTKGYTPENCQVVCWWYNVSKQQFNDEEVYELCKATVTMYEMNRVQNAVS